jgi:diguanylate cyclase (GGDEF)-like protein/PAS domain S-box-containing protein
MRPQAQLLFSEAYFEDFFQFLTGIGANPEGNITEDQRTLLNVRTRELRNSILRFQSLVQVLTEGILVRDKDGVLRTYNPSAEKLLGVRLRSRIGKATLGRVKLLDQDGNPLKEHELPYYECLRTQAPRIGFHFGVSRPDGVRWFETNSQPVFEKMPRRLIGVVSSFWDITDKKLLYDHLVNEATHDPLTGLPNRRALDAKLNRALAAAGRKGGQVSLCICDLDHFKLVNDQLGHTEGDKVLCRFADILRLSLRAEDFPARVGGDEFAILFEGTPASRAAVTLERIRKQFSSTPPIRLGTVSATFGIVDWSPGMPAAALGEAADEALYRAKAGGRNQVLVGGSVQETAQDESRLDPREPQ